MGRLQPAYPLTMYSKQLFPIGMLNAIVESANFPTTRIKINSMKQRDEGLTIMFEFDMNFDINFYRVRC